MSQALTLQAILQFTKNGATVESTSAGLLSSGMFDVAGQYYAKVPLNVDRAGTTLDKGSIGTIGMVMLKNLGTAGVPDAPVVTVTTAGTPGATTRKYKVVANFADGSISVSDEFTIATTNATLNGSNYDVVAWTDVGADTYDIYRTVSGGTPATTGLIAAGETGSSYNDQGAAGDSASVPAEVASDFAFEYCSDGAAWDFKAKAGEPALFRFNETDIHVRAAGPPVEIEPTLIED
jgi:hypothetical protein